MNTLLIVLSFIGIIITGLSINKKIPFKIEYLLLLTFTLIIIQNFNKSTISKIETFDGSQVVFDKDAFVNLNRIVKEIAGDGNLTIPGNLIVQGNTTLQKDLTVDKTATMKGKTIMKDDCKLEGQKTLESHFLKVDTIEGKSYGGNKIQMKPGLEFINYGNSKVRLSENGNMEGKEIKYEQLINGDSLIFNHQGGLWLINANVFIKDGKTNKFIKINDGNIADVGSIIQRNGSTLQADTLQGISWRANKIQMKKGLQIINEGNKKVRLGEDGNMEGKVIKFEGLNNGSTDIYNDGGKMTISSPEIIMKHKGATGERAYTFTKHGIHMNPSELFHIKTPKHGHTVIKMDDHSDDWRNNLHMYSYKYQGKSSIVTT